MNVKAQNLSNSISLFLQMSQQVNLKLLHTRNDKVARIFLLMTSTVFLVKFIKNFFFYQLRIDHDIFVSSLTKYIQTSVVVSIDIILKKYNVCIRRENNDLIYV